MIPELFESDDPASLIGLTLLQRSLQAAISVSVLFALNPTHGQEHVADLECADGMHLPWRQGEELTASEAHNLSGHRHLHLPIEHVNRDLSVDSMFLELPAVVERKEYDRDGTVPYEDDLPMAPGGCMNLHSQFHGGLREIDSLRLSGQSVLRVGAESIVCTH